MISDLFLRKIKKALFLLGLLFVFLSSSYAEEWDFYSIRPDILQVQPMALEKSLRPPEWSEYKRAQWWTIALLLEMYPQHEIYFLARDAEFIYDSARLATKGTERDRLKILNVSNSSRHNRNLIDYLNQEGLSKERLAQKIPILLFDTGFAGSTFRIIEELLKPESLELRYQLILSESTDHPSLRTFLHVGSPSILNQAPYRAHHFISDYENLGKFTSQSLGYFYRDQTWLPVSQIEHRENASTSYNRQEAHWLMQDLVYEWNQPSTQKEFQETRALARELIQLLQEERPESLARLKEILQTHPNKDLVESMVRDIFDAKTQHRLRLHWKPQDLFKIPVPQFEAQQHLGLRNCLKLFEK